MTVNGERTFTGYEYKDITVFSGYAFEYIECYKNFGWCEAEEISSQTSMNLVTIRMKRNRKIINKVELTRLERHFEACAAEIKMLEKAKTAEATACSLLLGIAGILLVIGVVFGFLREFHLTLMGVVFGIAGMVGMGLSCPLYTKIVKIKSQKLEKYIEAKHDEVYYVCKKGFELL